MDKESIEIDVFSPPVSSLMWIMDGFPLPIPCIYHYWETNLVCTPVKIVLFMLLQKVTLCFLIFHHKLHVSTRLKWLAVVVCHLTFQIPSKIRDKMNRHQWNSLTESPREKILQTHTIKFVNSFSCCFCRTFLLCKVEKSCVFIILKGKTQKSPNY